MKPQYNLFDIIPYRAEHIITDKEEDLVILAYPRFKKQWMTKYLLPKNMSSHIHVRLEEHGTAVWELINGVRTVREITDLLAEYFAGEDYQFRVTTFITQLHKDGFIKYGLSRK